MKSESSIDNRKGMYGWPKSKGSFFPFFTFLKACKIFSYSFELKYLKKNLFKYKS